MDLWILRKFFEPIYAVVKWTMVVIQAIIMEEWAKQKRNQNWKKHKKFKKKSKQQWQPKVECQQQFTAHPSAQKWRQKWAQNHQNPKIKPQHQLQNALIQSFAFNEMNRIILCSSFFFLGCPLCCLAVWLIYYSCLLLLTTPLATFRFFSCHVHPLIIAIIIAVIAAFVQLLRFITFFVSASSASNSARQPPQPAQSSNHLCCHTCGGDGRPTTNCKLTASQGLLLIWLRA